MAARLLEHGPELPVSPPAPTKTALDITLPGDTLPMPLLVSESTPSTSSSRPECPSLPTTCFSEATDEIFCIGPAFFVFRTVRTNL